MAGSEFFRRTSHDQTELARRDGRRRASWSRWRSRIEGKEVSLYRDGQTYARYTMETDPAQFDQTSIALWACGTSRSPAAPRSSARSPTPDLPRCARRGDARHAPSGSARRAPPAGLVDLRGRHGDRHDGRFPPGRLIGKASISGGRLHLDGGYVMAGKGLEPPRTREQEDWPTYHISALPEEGLCRPYDANGCIYWKGKYHLMYIYQDPNRPHGGHSWGHAVSTDLVNWTFIAPALVPEPGDPDVGIFSGNAFINKDGVPMLCWFGVGAGVCVATAEDDDLIRWKKHPRNPIVPMPKPGQPGHGVYTVWDPYLWLEGDTYYCLLGGNKLPDGKDTLYTMKSRDLVNWTPLHPFYQHPDLSWTTPGRGLLVPRLLQAGRQARPPLHQPQGRRPGLHRHVQE